MSEKLSRRDFLKLAGETAGVLALIAYGRLHNRQLNLDPVFKVDFDKDLENLNYNEASRLALRFDKVADKLPEQFVEPTKENLIKLALEIIPQFEYEGIAKSQYPKEIDFKFYADGDRANHVLGQSDCSTWAVINGRASLDTSAWYGEDIVFTLAHELAHVAQTQPLCISADRALIENSAQIGALEVCSGLANQGNKLFLRATVDEIRGMAITSAYGLALKENRFEEFKDLRSKLSPGAISEARFAKSRRRWSTDPMQLQEIIYRYNITPMNMVINAISTNNSEISGLAFPNNLPQERLTPVAPPIKLDDTKYLIEHLEEIVNDSIKK